MPDRIRRQVSSAGILPIEEQNKLGNIISRGIAAGKRLKETNDPVQTMRLELAVRKGIEARNRLALHSRWLVGYFLSRPFSRRMLNFRKLAYSMGILEEDMLQAGEIGLLLAAEKWTPAMGGFGTYSRYWICAEFFKELNKRADLRIPVNTAHHLNSLQAAIDAYEALGRKPSPDEIRERIKELNAEMIKELKSIERAGSPEKAKARLAELKRLVHAARRAESLDAAIAPDSQRRLLDTLAYPADYLDEIIDRGKIRKIVMDTLRAAQPKIRQVIAARFFNKSRQPTLQEVADVMGITRERVRQLENTGLAMLRIALTGGQMELHHGRTVEGTKKNLTCTPSRDKLIRALKGETGRTDMVRRAVIALAFEGTPITKKNIRRVLESYPDQGTSGDKNGSIRYVLRTLKKKGLLERRKKNPG